MRKLNEIKENYAKELGYANWEACINDQPNYKVESLMDEVALRLSGVRNSYNRKDLDTDYPLIPMSESDAEARIIAVRWHESATNWIGDKHKLASDIMNYARRKRLTNLR